jgi:multidrug efflux system membrane fusion protein
VVGANDIVSLRQVTLGPASGDLVSVSSGVKAGEQVVIDGVDKLRDGAHVTTAAPASVGGSAGGKGGHKKKAAADGQAKS